jgi:hypothetical protein
LVAALGAAPAADGLVPEVTPVEADEAAEGGAFASSLSERTASEITPTAHIPAIIIKNRLETFVICPLLRAKTLHSHNESTST